MSLRTFLFVKIIYAWAFPWNGCCIKLFCRYKNELRKEDKDDLRILLKKQKHKLVRLLFLMPIIVSLLFVGLCDLHTYLFGQNMISMLHLCMQVTPEIIRELDSSRNRGEKEDDLISIYILCFVKSILFSKYIYF